MAVTKEETKNGAGSPDENAAVVASLARELDEGPPGTITLKNGIMLKLKPVAPLAIREAAVRVQPPEVPIVFVEEKQREERNPADPAYLRAVDRYEADQIIRVADVLVLMGTKVEYIPEGLSRPEDDDWIDLLEAVDIQVPRDNKYRRYLAWVRYSAIEDEEDIGRVVAAVVRLSGVTEVEVDKAAQAFRSPS